MRSSNFREWLSDNLRYILLIAGVLAVLVGLFFGVRAISGRLSGGQEPKTSREIVTLNPDSVIATVVSVVETPVLDAPSSDALQENAVPEITQLMTQYYDALGRQDLAAVKTLTDTLPESEAAHISSSTAVYSDIRVYTKPGPDTSSYVVYTRYSYKDVGQPAFYPGLTESFVRHFGNAGYKLVFSELDDATKEYIADVTAGEDVQALINEVKIEYNAAKKAAEEAAANVAAAAQATQSGAQPVLEADGADTVVTANTGGNTGTSGSSKVQGEAGTADASVSSSTRGTYDGSTGIVLDNVNIRSGPDRESEKIGTVPEGSEVEVSSTTENGWRLIRYDDMEGYIAGNYLEHDGDDEEESPVEEENVLTPDEDRNGDSEGDDGEEEYADDSEHVGVIRSDVNIRSGAGYDYNVIDTVPGGATVTVYGSNEHGWWHISTGDTEGYVGQSYIDVS